MTASLTVCQAQPCSEATSHTERANRPTWAVIERPTRSVIDFLGAAIAGETSVNDRPGQSGSTQTNLRLCHTVTTGRPKYTMSTRSTSRRSLGTASTPHTGQPTGAGIVSMWTSSMPSSRRPTARTETPGSPTSSSHLRVGSVSTGILLLKWLNNSRVVDPRYAPVDPCVSAKARSLLDSEEPQKEASSLTELAGRGRREWPGSTDPGHSQSPEYGLYADAQGLGVPSAVAALAFTFLVAPTPTNTFPVAVR